MKSLLMIFALVFSVESAFAQSKLNCKKYNEPNSEKLSAADKQSLHTIGCAVAQNRGYYVTNPKKCIEHTEVIRVCTNSKTKKIEFFDANISYARNNDIVKRGSVRYDDRVNCRISLPSKASDCSKI